MGELLAICLTVENQMHFTNTFKLIEHHFLNTCSVHLFKTPLINIFVVTTTEIYQIFNLCKMHSFCTLYIFYHFSRFYTEALEGHFYLLLTTYYLSLITYYLLLITYYLSLITYYLLLIISFITPITAGNSKYTFPVTAVAVVVVVVAVYL